MRCKLMMPARAAAALLVLLVLAGCGASEPQLPCNEVYQKVYEMARQLDRDDQKVMASPIDRYQEVCAAAKANVRQWNELQKLLRNNKDRCKEYNFREISAFSIDNAGVSGPMAEAAHCK